MSRRFIHVYYTWVFSISMMITFVSRTIRVSLVTMVKWMFGVDDHDLYIRSFIYTPNLHTTILPKCHNSYCII